MSSPRRPLRRSRRQSPPVLGDDATSEIFQRLPPDDPASLVRAAAVCKNWRRILSDASFARVYREFHGAPPVLGFLHNSCCYDKHCVSHFVPTTASFRPPGCGDRRDWYVLDARHGRVLFWTPRKADDFLVCDPMTGARWKIPSTHSAVLPSGDDGDEEFGLTWNAAVLCSSKCCDHLDCRGGPFLVALVYSDELKGITSATVYSSETGEWSKTVSLDQPNAISEVEVGVGHTVLLEDKMYFPCEITTKIVEYNVGEQELSVINTPYKCRQHRPVDTPFHGGDQLVLMAADDGMLLFVGMWEFKLHLCSIEPGAAAWARCRLIELKPLLSTRTLSRVVSVVGAVEGASVIFVNTEAGLFKIDLKAGRSSKVYGKAFFEKIIPYTSFYNGVRKLLPGK
uniref:Uncharacterized protein n=1 Tax=Avena sativa TaxID=4498 RepID=A0ACD5WC84_AVESA